MSVRPLGSKVFVRRVRLDAASAGGIVIPETARKKRPNEGEVVAIGDQVEGIEIGQRVFFERYAGDEIGIDGVPHLKLEFGEIIAVVDQQAP